MGFRGRFIAVLALISVPLLVADVWSAADQYRDDVRQLETSALAAGKAVQENLKAFNANMLTILQQANLTEEMRGRDRQACHDYLNRIYEQRKLSFDNIARVDMNGRVLCWARDGLESKTKLSPITFALFKKIMQTKMFSAGDAGLSLISGNAILPFGVPIFDRDGELDGALIVGVMIDYLNERTRALGFPDEFTVGMYDRSGTLLSSFPAGRIPYQNLPFLHFPPWRDDETLRRADLVFAGDRPILGVALPYGDGLQVAVLADKDLALSGRIRTLIRSVVPKVIIVLVATLFGTLVGLRLLRRLDETNGQLLLSDKVFNNTVEAIIVADEDLRVMSVNPAFSAITGYAGGDVMGTDLRSLLSEGMGNELFDDLWLSVVTAGQWKGELWNRKKDGEPFLAWQTITAVRDAAWGGTRYVSVFSDMTELRRKEDRIRHQALHDALTGLPNRLLLQDRLSHAIEVGRREGSELAVMFLDLDRFKVVNDSLGHDVGDLILMEVADRLTGCLRRSDSIARIGGDEFVVIQGDVASAGESVELAEKIISLIAEPMRFKGHEIRIGASIGIAQFPVDGADAATLMKSADAALYQAKAAGRNTFRFFDESMNAEAMERLSLEAALGRALEANEFELHYQPKVGLLSGQMHGVEALIRWRHPQRGLVSPAQFIPLAEETGLIAKIGDWVLMEACRQIQRWQEEHGLAISVAVNVSARQFLDPQFADRLAATVKDCGVKTSQLEVEVTESTAMTAPEQAIAQLLRLRGIGVEVAVDDFGTGYSSLSYLKRLPVSQLKIDRTFIHHIDTDRENAAIVNAIIAVGHALGVSIVAEGVETEEEAEHLRRIGCPVAQGYRYARPMPGTELPAWMERLEMASQPV